MRAYPYANHSEHMGVRNVPIPMGRKPLRPRNSQIHHPENDQANLEMGRGYMGRP